MAGASTALCSRAVQPPPFYSYQPASDCRSQPSSISRLCLSKQQLPRLRSHVPAFPAGFRRSPIPSNDRKFKRSLLHRDLLFSLAASSEDSASTSFEGPESGKRAEDSKKPASDLSKFLNLPLKEEVTEATDKDTVSGQDTVSKAEAVAKEEGNESANKFIGVLRDTTEELKEQAEKARAALAATAQETAAVLAATAQETAEKSKENLSYIAENAPDPIRDIADTALKAHSADTPKSFAKIHDFCLGIPYGSTLVIGGLFWFILSGSTAAIRFGVILGGILLGLSVASLNAWKEGKPTNSFIKGQAAISFVLAFRQIRRLAEVKAFFPAAFLTLISTGMLGFYCYVLLAGGNPPKKVKHAPAA